MHDYRNEKSQSVLVNSSHQKWLPWRPWRRGIPMGVNSRCTPLQCSCLENPTDGRAWWAAVHGVAKSRTRLSDFTFTFSLSCIGQGNGNRLHCSCLENPRGRRAWWAAIYGVTQSWTWLKWLSSSSSRNSTDTKGRCQSKEEVEYVLLFFHKL